MKSRFAIFILLIAMLFATSQCALFHRENLRLVTATEEHLVPEDPTLKIITAPLYIPIGVASGILDVFFIHPISVVPRSGMDTVDALWKPRGLGYYTTWGSVPFSALATPPFFLLAWSYHWLFNTPGDPKLAQPEASKFPIWKKNMLKASRNQDREALKKIIYHSLDHKKEHPDKTLDVLIQVHNNIRKGGKSDEMILSYIFYYPPENKKALNHIIQVYNVSDHSWDFENYLNKCKLPDCRAAVLNKMKDPKTNPGTIPRIIETYMNICTEEEQKELLNRIRKP